jgi:hypothetical protein
MIIKCKIQVPEFKEGIVYEYYKQSGTFNTETLLFTPNEFFGIRFFGYPVYFQSMEEFEKCRIDKPKYIKK